LYGTTEQGGRSNAGTIFRIGENGRNYAILFHFERALGQGPRGALLTGDDGSLYGTTQFGGGASNGVIYKLNLDGTGFRLLHQLPDLILNTVSMEAHLLHHLQLPLRVATQLLPGMC
jgi:uncharacterized repeat protein (TIGR03803 family)